MYGQSRLCSNPADVCKRPRKARNVTRRIFRRLHPAGHETIGGGRPRPGRVTCVTSGRREGAGGGGGGGGGGGRCPTKNLEVLLVSSHLYMASIITN